MRPHPSVMQATIGISHSTVQHVSNVDVGRLLPECSVLKEGGVCAMYSYGILPTVQSLTRRLGLDAETLVRHTLSS